jgi:uncharacterized phiE125 gp8 family phage protein
MITGSYTNLTYHGYLYGAYGYYGYYETWYQHYPYPFLPHAISIVTTPPAEEPFTLDEAKLRANFTWPSPDERDAMITSFISAARAKVEFDTGLSLIDQTRAIYLDTVQSNVILLPDHSMPLQSVESIVTIDRDGNSSVVDPATYVVDFASARIALVQGQYWPTNLRNFQPWQITITAGWPDAATFARMSPELYHAVGLLIAHYCTLGRDLATIERGTLDEIPQGYSELIAPYQVITVV